MIMPDVASTKPHRAFGGDQTVMLLSKNVSSYGDAAANPLQVTFPYVLSVMNRNTKSFLLMVTLEDSLAAKNVLCVTEPDDVRSNLGTNPSLRDEALFVAAAQALVRKHLGIGPITELGPSSSNRQGRRAAFVLVAVLAALGIGWLAFRETNVPNAQPSPKLVSVDYDPFRLQPFSHGTTTNLVPLKNQTAQLRIVTSPGSNYFLKIARQPDNAVVLRAQISGGTDYQTKLSPGQYELKYASGKYWYGETDYFGTNSVFAKTDRNISVSNDKIVTIELILQPSGNLATTKIRQTDF